MNRHSSIAATLLTLMIAACANAPRHSPQADEVAMPSAPTCAQLDEQLARTEEARRAADEKGQNAWKAVVPFAVAARYASGKAAANEAEDTIAELRSQAALRGCTGHGN